MIVGSTNSYGLKLKSVPSRNEDDESSSSDADGDMKLEIKKSLLETTSMPVMTKLHSPISNNTYEPIQVLPSKPVSIVPLS
jgi:hypothetical protein